MSDIIMDLFHGKISPFHDYTVETENYLKNRKKFLELGKEIQERLDEETYSIFKEYCTYSENLIAISNEETFKKGFILGGKIFAEVLLEKRRKSKEKFNGNFKNAVSWQDKSTQKSWIP